MVRLKRKFRKINPRVYDLVESKIEWSNLNNMQSRNSLISWINGVATCEKDRDLKAELKRVRSELQNYGT